jgi:hypothetical protein
MQFANMFVVQRSSGDGESGDNVLAVDNAIGRDVLHVFGEGGVAYPR